ncbi:MAG: bifunctional N-acetylglucosamine-1-phosphate uridyltransferase/glucosamine-1-phosphate acetyltransferase [Planctomycetes bacterium]|nr:bifunctional N-acetylglucosamine-1-phosphate uridyltransferase/glucosamine-1-phosphate acetyltransferase [Planctomycetota bacterium]
MSRRDRIRAVVLAAGLGTRMKSSSPKVLHDLCGWPLLAHPLAALAGLGSALEETIVVVGHRAGEVREACAKDRGKLGDLARDVRWVVQDPPRGTGDAVRQAAGALDGFEGVLLVLNGDSPLVETDDLERLLATLQGEGNSPLPLPAAGYGICEANAAPAAPTPSSPPAGALLTAELARPGKYGRVLRAASGTLRRIVEAAEASPEELAVREVNVGAYAFRWPRFARALEQLTPSRKEEYYLTQAVELLVGSGESVLPVLSEDSSVALGVNSQAELAEANATCQARIKSALMAGGVSIPEPSQVYLERDVAVGADTVIYPFSVVRTGCRIGQGCRIGPFAHLRSGTVIEDGAEIGNFVEVKAARIGSGAKAKHLAYLGDVEVGERANIGAGTIVANYDGQEKHRTRIGAGAFIGSGTVLVAPVEVGERALTGAGAVVLAGKNVGPGEVVVGVPSRKVGMRRW